MQGSAVATTIDEVKRVLRKGEGSETNTVIPQSGSTITIDERRDFAIDSPAANSISSRDDDKNLLKDIFDLRNFSLSTKPNDHSGSSIVQVRQVSSRKYKDSDSSEGSMNEVESPQVSGQDGCCISDYVRSSIHTNASSIVSGNELSVYISESNFEDGEENYGKSENQTTDYWEHSNSCKPKLPFENMSANDNIKSLCGGNKKDFQTVDKCILVEQENKTKSEISSLCHHSQFLTHAAYQEGEL